MTRSVSPPNNRMKHLWRRLLLVAVGTGAGLLLAEVSLRVVDGGHFIGRGLDRLMCRYDPRLGWVKVPNGKATLVTSEYEVREEFNSKGLRGPEYDYAKPQGEYRILVLGDSFAEGYTVEFSELFSEKLRLELREGGVPCEVVNAGTGGYSTDQELLWFRDEGVKYAPDLTILLFSDNDPWYNTQGRYWMGFKPVFEFDGERLELRNVPVPAPWGADISSRKLKDRFAGLKSWLRQHSHAYSLLSRGIKRSAGINSIAIKIGLASESETDLPRAGDELVSIPDVFRVYQTDEREQFERAWRTTEALLRELALECKSAGSDLLVFYVPSSYCIDDGKWEGMKKKYAWDEPAWSRELPARRLAAICEGHGIDFMDPTARMREEVAELYFALDGHWNRQGHALIGRLLAQRLLARN